MDANSGRALAERLAQRNGGEPTPPVRGREQGDAAPIFRWFAIEPDAEPEPNVRPAAA